MDERQENATEVAEGAPNRALVERFQRWVQNKRDFVDRWYAEGNPLRSLELEIVRDLEAAADALTRLEAIRIARLF